MWFILVLLLCMQTPGWSSVTPHIPCRITTLQQRPALPFRTFSPSGHFAIHYDTAGINGVHSPDRDLNGIPDFVDTAGIAFDSAWNVLIHTLRFPIPPLDSGKFYAVFIQNLGSQGLYGLTAIDRFIGSGGDADRFTTFIIIDNDYSSTDSLYNEPVYFLPPEPALRTTAVHEFFHAIQIGIYGRFLDEALFHELSSSWVEMIAYPDVPSFVPWTRLLLQNPDRFPFSNATDPLAGYAYAPFAWYCTKQSSDSLIRRMWELRSVSGSFYGALDAALSEQHQSLAHLWCQFAEILLRLDRSDAPLPHSQLLFAPQPFEQQRVSTTPAMLTGALDPMELRFFRFFLPSVSPAPDTLDLVIASADIAAAAMHTQHKVEYRLAVAPDHSLDLSFLPADSIGCWDTLLSPSAPYTIAETPYPQPFDPDQHRFLYFPVPRVSGVLESVRLEIFSTALELLGTQPLPVVFANNYWNARWNGLLNDHPLRSGVYLYRISAKDRSLWGKFTVIHR